MRHPYGVNSIAPAPGRPGRRERRSDTPRAAAVQLVIVRPGLAELADFDEVRDNPAVDPVVVALTQLVRDRWASERRARAGRRTRFRVVRGDSE